MNSFRGGHAGTHGHGYSGGRGGYSETTAFSTPNVLSKKFPSGKYFLRDPGYGGQPLELFNILSKVREGDRVRVPG